MGDQRQTRSGKHNGKNAVSWAGWAGLLASKALSAKVMNHTEQAAAQGLRPLCLPHR
jgi:hypothetical protein